MPSSSRLLLGWALAVAAPAVEVAAVGTVAIDSGATVALNAPAKELVISWRRPDGATVRPGEVLLRFDTSLVERTLDDRKRSARAARIEHERQVALRAGEVAELEAEQRRLRAELVLARAWVALAEERDPQRLDLLRAEVRSARLAAEVADREAARVRLEQAQGRASLADAEATQRAAETARRAIALSELTLAESESPGQVPLDAAKARLRVEEVAVRLGLGDDGSEDPALGIGARIAGARAQGEADLATRRIDLERIEAELKESERDVRDRTPLVGLEITPVGSKEPLARIRFVPKGRRPPEGWTADNGGLFADDRGWQRRLDVAELPWREAAAPPQRAGGARPEGERQRGGPPGGGRRRGGGGGGAGASGQFTGGLALIASPATWSLAVPRGRYSVTVSLGDDRAWDGAAITVEGEPLPLPARIGPGRSEFRIEVPVEDGRLDLAIGDGETKALRAEKAGAISWQDHARVGFRVKDPSWTLGFLAAVEARVVDLLVAQEIAPLLLPGRTAAAADAPLAERIMLAGVAMRRDGQVLPATVLSVGAQNVRNERGERAWDAGNPADAIAREVRLRPDPAIAGRLAQGESVEVALTFRLPAATTALPPHLVRIDRDGAAIRRRGERKDEAVEALRLGHHVVVAGAFDPAGLVPPQARSGPIADALGRYRGEVIPGTRTRVSLNWISGRVESLIEDGSLVKTGEVVLTVYNPQMEENRERLERDRRAAVQRVIAAAERRRQDLMRAQGEHASRRIAESSARLQLRRHNDDDPLGRESARTGLLRAEADLAAARLRSQRLAGLSQPDAADSAAAAHAATLAAFAQERAALQAAAWELRLDWFKGSDLAAAWSDAVQALARRDAELTEAAVQERINTLADRIAMERAVEGDWWQRHFSSRRLVKAPVDGRILFQTGWNDQTQRSEKIGREFPVWGGMTVAEIVDEKTLRFATELPEDRFPGLAEGTACEIEFEAAPGRAVPGAFSELGRAFLIPRDRLAGAAEEAVSNRRAFSAIVTFSPPDDLRRRLSTGAKGWVRLP